MPTPQISPVQVSGPIKVVAVGYTPGTLASYAGLTVQGNNGGSSQFPLAAVVNTGSFPNDLAIVRVMTRNSEAGAQSFGSGVTYDSSVDSVINDYCEAHGGT